jgi:hypothetical protein
MKKLIKQVIFAFAVFAIPHLSNAQQSQVPDIKNSPVVKEEDAPLTKSELKEVVFTQEEVESIIQMTRDYWTNIAGKTMEELLKEKKIDAKSKPGRGALRRRLRSECNPFHHKWWK